MQGIALIDKPAGWTSFDVVAALRRSLGIKKIGHSGTLDPMATGVLPVFIGRATRLIDLLPITDKRYRATIRFGLTTDTLDITGKVLSQSPVSVTREQLEAALSPFRGEIMQVPPMVSALTHNGRRLYDLAREGKVVERPSRPVTIYELCCLGPGEEANEFVLDVFCSKGTYIRTLCDDLGRALGCGAVLSRLCRTEAAGFRLADCVPVDVARNMQPKELLHPPETALQGYPQVRVSEGQKRRFQNGGKLALDRLPSARGVEGLVRLITPSGKCIGLGRITSEEACLRVACIFEED